MTKEKRAEMKIYRDKAVEIENKLKRKKTLIEANFVEKTLQCNEAGNEYIKASVINNQNIYGKKDRTLLPQLDLSTENQEKIGGNFICEALANAFTNSSIKEDEHSQGSISDSSIISNITLTKDSKSDISIPAIIIDSPTPTELKQETNLNSELKRNDVERTLIRSNSFTLENPSNVLLQHIRRQKTAQRKKSTVTNDTIESKAKQVMVSDSNANVPSICNKRSPYDSKYMRINRKKVVSLCKARFSPKGAFSMNTLKYVEETHRQKFIDLLKSQKEEHKKLQENFEIQQELLITKFIKEMTANKLSSRSSASDLEMSPLSCKSHSDVSETEKKTPRRKLFESPSDNTTAKRRVSFQ